MYSRYDLMGESKVLDSKDQVNYPDPLSFNYTKVKLTALPKLRELSQVDLDRFWLFILKHYETIAEGDDIVLTLNNIPYLGMLQPGDKLFLPSADDVYNIKNLIE